MRSSRRIVLVASIVSVELGVTVALLELTLGVAAGNIFHLDSQDLLDFIAKFASIVLTFLAGIEVDPAFMWRRLGASVGIGVVSFVGPFVVASAVAYLLLDWPTRASLITGTALSTTSLAVVFAVLVERGLTDTSIGKLVMSATFQFSLLVTVVVLSAVVPTAIAERWFLPDAERERRVDRRLAYAKAGEYV